MFNTILQWISRQIHSETYRNKKSFFIIHSFFYHFFVDFLINDRYINKQVHTYKNTMKRRVSLATLIRELMVGENKQTRLTEDGL